MAGTRRDFTAGNPAKEMLLFAIPLIGTMILQNLYTTADLVIVGRYVGDSALAAVGATASISTMVLMLIAGATEGMSVIIAQFYGAKDYEKVRRTVTNSLYLIAGMALVFGVLGAMFAKPLLMLIHVTPENGVLESATAYLRIIFLGEVATSLYNMANSLSRALGDSLTPLIVLVVCSIMNVLLNFVFVARLGMGVEGVAYATILATICSAFVSWVLMLKKNPVVRFGRKDMKIDRSILILTAKIGVPSAMKSSTTAIGNILLQNLVNSFGMLVMAGYNAGIQLERLIANPPGGITQAMQVFAGQNVGAGQQKRVKKGFTAGFCIITIYCIFSAIVLVAGGKFLIGLFSADAGSAMMDIGYAYLVTAAFSTYFCGMAWLTKSTLIGAGDASAGLYISVIEILVRVVVSYILAWYTPLGYLGIFIATPISYVASGIYGLVRFRGGKWMKKRFVE